MPSPAHEVMVDALGERPALLALLIEKVLGRPPPLPLEKVDSTVRVADPEEVRPDIVLYAVDALLDESHPELALIAAWAMHHRHGPRARAIVARAIQITEALPEPLRGAQQRAIRLMLSERMRAFLEEFLMNPDKFPEPESARRLGEAMDRFRNRAIAEGEARGEARAVLTVLEARGLVPSEEQRARVLACEDLETLHAWLRRAATAASVDDALG